MHSLLPPAPGSALPSKHRLDVWRATWRGLTVQVPEALLPLDPARRKRCGSSLLAFALEYFPGILGPQRLP